jgi:hypothetical protein
LLGIQEGSSPQDEVSTGKESQDVMNQYWIGIFVVVVGGIALVLAIWGIKQFIQQDKQYQKEQENILQNGVCVVGRIVKYEDAISGGTKVTLTYYHVMYSYEYEGKTYTREQEVPKEIYLASPDETQVSVHFLPADPTNIVTNIDVGIR